MDKITARTPEQHPIPATLHFLFCNHSFNNYPRILDAIGKTNPDIVAIELVGESPAARVAMEQEINAQLSGAEPSPDIEIGWFEEDLIARFAGADVACTLIDISSDHPAWEYHVSSLDHLQQYEKQTDETSRRIHAKAFMTHSAISMAQRERYTASTLAQLAYDNPGKSIVVVVGMMHSGVQRQIGAGIISSRQFINTLQEEGELRPGQKASFNAHEAGRRAYIAGVVSIDEMLAAAIDEKGSLRDD